MPEDRTAQPLSLNLKHSRQVASSNGRQKWLWLFKTSIVRSVFSPVIELMTIGYEGLAPALFFDLLRRRNVSMIVDVRERPISRRAGFAKTALSAGLAAHGIKYVHLPALGCPRDIRHEYRDDGDWGRYTLRFKGYLETQDDGLSELSALMRVERCCLLCFEADYNFCHRSFVAERVASFVDAPLRVFHLTGPIRGQVVQHELATA